MRKWLASFLPAPMKVDGRERLRAVLGAALGILVTALISHLLAGPALTPWMVAPLGASAVLVFAVPASPLAQPWSVVGGNTLSALVGVGCVNLLGATEVAAGLAVSLAIAVMFACRCLHPPGGAAALLVALGGVTDPRFALFPVLTNSVLLVACGIAWNNATKRRYPHQQLAPKPDAELERVLANYNQVLDVPRDDLEALLEEVRLRGLLKGTRCGEVMTSPAVSITGASSPEEISALFATHGFKTVPVVDAGHRVVGIVSATDPRTTQTAVQTVHHELHLSELLPLFASTGHHHLPVVDSENRLVGMITESNVMRALIQ